MNRPRPRNRSTWRPSFWDGFKKYVPLIELTAVLLALWSSCESRLSSQSAEQSAKALRDALILQQTSVGLAFKVENLTISGQVSDSITIEYSIVNLSDYLFESIQIRGLVTLDFGGRLDDWLKIQKSEDPIDITQSLSSYAVQQMPALSFELAKCDSFLFVVDIQWRLSGMDQPAHSWRRFNCKRNVLGEYNGREY